jgi:hypothetical protein
MIAWLTSGAAAAVALAFRMNSRRFTTTVYAHRNNAGELSQK